MTTNSKHVLLVYNNLSLKNMSKGIEPHLANLNYDHMSKKMIKLNRQHCHLKINLTTMHTNRAQ